MRPCRSVVITPERIDSTIRSCKARRSASERVAAASCTSETACRCASLAANNPTTRNEMSDNPTDWMVLAITSLETPRVLASDAQAVKATALPMEVIIVSRDRDDDNVERSVGRGRDAGDPNQPGHQQHVEKELQPRLSEIVFPGETDRDENYGQSNNGQDKRRDGAAGFDKSYARRDLLPGRADD